MREPKALVVGGDGINCEREMAFALGLAGFEAIDCHVSDLLQKPSLLTEVHLLCIPGGFAFGDEIASGKVLAVKLKEHLTDVLQAFIDQGKLVLGVCNGFQVLVQMGILPLSEANAPRLVSLTRNVEGKFINRWLTLEIDGKPSSAIYFRGLKKIELPIRHGEGRIQLASLPDSSQVEEQAKIVRDHAALRYVQNVNGSWDRIAALTNKTGTVMGLMPHPEAFVRWTQHPQWTNKIWRQSRTGSDKVKTMAIGKDDKAMPDGLAILTNAAKYLQDEYELKKNPIALTK